MVEALDQALLPLQQLAPAQLSDLGDEVTKQIPTSRSVSMQLQPVQIMSEADKLSESMMKIQDNTKKYNAFLEIEQEKEKILHDRELQKKQKELDLIKENMKKEKAKLESEKKEDIKIQVQQRI